MTNKRIAYVVNHVAFFVSHRLPLALACRKMGLDVCLFTGKAGSKEMEQFAVVQLHTKGVKHRRAIFGSSSINPLCELLGLLQLVWFIVRFRPDVVHCASPKGVLYGGIASRLCGVRGLVLSISGMGYAYTNSREQGSLRGLVQRIYGFLAALAFDHPNSRVIVQNLDDYKLVINKSLAELSCLKLIPGSGVDLLLFKDCDVSEKSLMVLLPARMLKDKGVEEFVSAAYFIKKIFPNWRFVLAGAASYDNPSAISVSRLKAWKEDGCVDWLGHVDDMIPLFREAAIVCLPSYREGMPKALLEAAAAGCAVVTTNVIGCREAIEPGVTGELVPVRDSQALVDTLISLIKDDERRKRYGAKGQERAKAIFSVDSVITETMKIYTELLDHD